MLTDHITKDYATKLMLLVEAETNVYEMGKLLDRNVGELTWDWEQVTGFSVWSIRQVMRILRLDTRLPKLSELQSMDFRIPKRGIRYEHQ